MADTVYEGMFLVNPNAYARNPGDVVKAVENTIKNAGGEILASRLWNEQKLAYSVNGHRKGVYWLTYFRMESTAMPKFRRNCQLQDLILRHLAIRVEPRLVDTLIAVAKGERLAPTPDIELVEEIDAEVEPVGVGADEETE
ncbi:MAG TPA: 30S ribosomal protein S6 [Pirellulaceae bacterium]|nr:30S ribosomal protein S6 [Pirellulaceae bacterium]